MNDWISVAAGFQHLFRPARRVFSQTFTNTSCRNRIDDGRHEDVISHASPFTGRHILPGVGDCQHDEFVKILASAVHIPIETLGVGINCPWFAI